MDERAKDLELWKRWRASRSPADLEALMRQVDPLLQREVNKWAAVVPRFVLLNEAKKAALKAFEGYDPNRKILLSTYLTSHLQKVSRTAYERQSTFAIPEQHRLTFNRVQRARAELEDELGHPPELHHVADHLGIPVPRLTDILTNVARKELMESGDGPAMGAEHDDGAVIELAYHQMTPRQRQIFDLRTGSHGRAEAGDDKQILRELGITQGQLSYELTKITRLLEQAKAVG